MKPTKNAFFLTLSVWKLVMYASLFLVLLVSVSLGAGGHALFRKGGSNVQRPPTDMQQGTESDHSQPTSQLHGIKIAVDAGHGGADRGVCHFPDELIEKEINLDMAFRLRQALEREGADVFLTRDEDVFVPLDARAEAANDFGADIFISLHVNRMPGHPGCFGAQTFYFPGSESGKALALALQNELVKVDPDNYRTPLTGNFKVLRLAEMTGALVEVAFMTNERDRALLQGDEYRDQVTRAIVKALINFVEAKAEDDPGAPSKGVPIATTGGASSATYAGGVHLGSSSAPRRFPG